MPSREARVGVVAPPRPSISHAPRQRRRSPSLLLLPALFSFEAAAQQPAPAPVAECASPRAAWIWCDDFEQDRLGRYFEHDPARGSFLREEKSGREESWAMRARFRPGQVGAGALHLAFGKVPNPRFRPVDDGVQRYTEIYWRFFLRTDADWRGGGGAKLTRATSFVSPTSWAQSMIAHVWSMGRGDRVLGLDPASGTDPAGRLRSTAYNDFPNLRWLGKAPGRSTIFTAPATGQWHCIEARVRLNRPGLADGRFDLWVNGVLDASREGLNWTGRSDDYGINAVFLENYWNGGAPREQARYFDNFVVSRDRIGC